jgi:hypothetical protein
MWGTLLRLFQFPWIHGKPWTAYLRTLEVMLAGWDEQIALDMGALNL